MKIDWTKSYDRWFSLHEIYESKALKASLLVSLFTFFVSFQSWLKDERLSQHTAENSLHLCWPYAQTCGEWAFLSVLPHGYSSNIFYTFAFIFIIGALYGALQNRWRLVHACIVPLFIWKLAVVFWFSHVQVVGNYEFYDLILTAILLFLPHKLFFLKFALVWFYFLSTTVKFDPGWTLGTYFSSLKLGLPLLPDAFMPVWTNLVILVEILLAWVLLFKPGLWQKTAFWAFVVFHVYSIVLIGYRYPASVVPYLLILFGPWYQYQTIPKGWSTLGGWGLLLFFGFAHLYSHFIPGNQRLTMEGNYYGLYMFEANHQCVITHTEHRTGQEPIVHQSESFKARNRCDAYAVWFRAQDRCAKNPEIERIEIQMDHSINGQPFYRIVDVPNICALEYNALSKNDWIKTPDTGAEPVGYPMKNFYYY